MILKNKKLSKSFITIIIIILIVSSFGWFFWPNIKLMIIGPEYKNIMAPNYIATIDINLKQNIILKLEKFKQYGEWPLSINHENQDRGNPFEPKR